MSSFSTPGIAALVLLASVIGYFGLCWLGRVADRRPDGDPRKDTL